MPGTFCASQLSPTSAVQPVSCELLQLLGITNARFGSVPPEMSAARSEYGRSLEWSRLEKSVHGPCLRVERKLPQVQTFEPAAGRFSEYARHVRPAASLACPRFSAAYGEP